MFVAMPEILKPSAVVIAALRPASGPQRHSLSDDRLEGSGFLLPSLVTSARQPA